MLVYVNITDRQTMDGQTHQKYISEPHKKNDIRCAKSKTYMNFFPSFFFNSKAHNMRWKKMTLVFDENASFIFYGLSKFF